MYESPINNHNLDLYHKGIFKAHNCRKFYPLGLRLLHWGSFLFRHVVRKIASKGSQIVSDVCQENELSYQRVFPQRQDEKNETDSAKKKTQELSSFKGYKVVLRSAKINKSGLLSCLSRTFFAVLLWHLFIISLYINHLA